MTKAEFVSQLKELKHIGLFIRYLFKRFSADGCRNSAAALTYTTLLSVVPFMAVTYAMISAIPESSDVAERVQSWIFDNFIPSTGATVQEYISQFAVQARKLTTIGILFLIITAYMMLTMVEKIFNAIWRVDQPRRGISSFMLYWSILSLGPMLLIVGFLLSSYLASISLFSEAAEIFGIKRLLLNMTPWLLTSASFALIYAAVPNCRVPIRHALLGGLIAGLLFEFAKRAFTWFVTQFPTYEFVYGAFATIPLFLVWVFLSWIIILMGMELVHAFSSYRRVAPHTHHAHLILVLALIHLLWKKQQQGNTLTNRDIWQGVRLLGQDRWFEYIKLLQKGKVIRRTDNGEYVLCRDLHKINLWELNQLLPWPLPQGQMFESKTIKSNSRSRSLKALLTGINEQAWHADVQQRLELLSSEKKRVLDVSLAELFTQSTNTKIKASK